MGVASQARFRARCERSPLVIARFGLATRRKSECRLPDRTGPTTTSVYRACSWPTVILPNRDLELFAYANSPHSSPLRLRRSPARNRPDTLTAEWRGSSGPLPLNSLGARLPMRTAHTRAVPEGEAKMSSKSRWRLSRLDDPRLEASLPPSREGGCSGIDAALSFEGIDYTSAGTRNRREDTSN